MFLGPSLGLSEARSIAPADYHPPVRRGDLERLAGGRPRVIAIIDGSFHQDVAVSPNELLTTLQRGHAVHGAASIGALRAVELRAAGMEGMGRVYEAFADGSVERDDEVAVSVDVATGAPLSASLFSMRIGFRAAHAAGLLERTEARQATELAERLHYTERSYRRVVAEMGLPRRRSDALLSFLEAEATDVKADDARILLRHIAAHGSDLHGAAHPAGQDGPTLAPRPRLRIGHPPIDDLPAASKVAGWDSVRTVQATETQRALDEVGRRLGIITRVAEITGLDTLGIPCFTAISPGPGVSVFSGKSLDPAQARVGAQMEAVELRCAHEPPRPVRRCTFGDFTAGERAIDPRSLPVLVGERRDLRLRELDWVPGWDVVTGQPSWVPADAVFSRPGPAPPWRHSSNGLASGNCLAEALVHGVAEVIERDAVTLQALECDFGHLPALLARVAGPSPGLAAARSVARSVASPGGALGHPLVSLPSLPPALGDAVARIRGAGAAVGLRWVSSDVSVPVFLCLVHERGEDGRSLTHCGSGAHPDAAVAARRAVTEAAQSRAGHITGTREDISVPALRCQEEPRDWFDRRAPKVAFGDLPSVRFDDVRDDLRHMVAALAAAGLSEVIAVDLSHPDVPLPVVKVIVPGAEPPLELWDRDRISLGWRARRIIERLARSDHRGR